MQWLRKLFHLDLPHIPGALWQSCIDRLPFVRHLSVADLARLKGISEKLLGTKTITGAAGFEITDEIAVMIVAQAALLVLNLTLDLYGDMSGIVVYPSAFIVPKKQTDAVGIVHEWREALAGQAMDGGGGVALSWEEVIGTADFLAGRNVVIHEFAHKIDMERGVANGCPPFLADYHQGMEVSIWQHAFTSAYNDFRRRIRAFDRLLPLDTYAAKSPAEFFAVASEAFFVAPDRLATDYPEVVRLLARYYRQEPIVAAGCDIEQIEPEQG